LLRLLPKLPSCIYEPTSREEMRKGDEGRERGEKGTKGR